MRRVYLRIAALAVLLAAMTASAVQAQTQSLYWERFDVSITVLDNGDLRVEETQVINFTSGVFTEGFAELVTTNTDGITDIVVSENGQPYDEVGSTFSVDEGEFAWDRLDNGNIEVVWDMGRTSNETRTFVLAYTVHGAIRRYDEGNEFQWNAISPNLHDFEIREATVTVTMPEGVPVTYADYLVPPDFRGVPMTVEGEGTSRVTWVAQEPLSPSEGIQIVVQFPPNTVGGGPPSWQADFDAQTRWEQTYKPWVDLGLLTLGLLTLLGGPALVYVLWHVRGRDPVIDAVPEYITQPPADVPPGMAGTLVDERADVADVIATLMDLARRGFLVIEESSSQSSPFRLVSKEFTLHQTAEGKNLGELNDYERALFNAVFRGRQSVRFRDLNQKFYANMPTLQNKMYEAAVKLGHFKSSPEAVRGSYGCLGGIMLVGVLVLGFVTLGALSGLTSTAICPIIGLGVTAVAMLVMSPHMPAKTRKGAEAAALSRAFKNYLQNLEKYADPAQVTDQFDKYLPYAIAFGLERTWINRFKKIPTTPLPGWYYPVGRPYATYGTPGTPGMGRPASTGQGVPGGAGASMPTLQQASDALSGGLQGISDGLNNMLNSAARTMTSTPPSSSTSRGGRSFSGGGGGFRSSGGSGGGGRGFR